MATNNSQRHDDVVQILHLHRYSTPPHNQDGLFPITVILHPGYCYRWALLCHPQHAKNCSVYQSFLAGIVLSPSVVVSVTLPILLFFLLGRCTKALCPCSHATSVHLLTFDIIRFHGLLRTWQELRISSFANVLTTARLRSLEIGAALCDILTATVRRGRGLLTNEMILSIQTTFRVITNAMTRHWWYVLCCLWARTDHRCRYRPCQQRDFIRFDKSFALWYL